ncbi:sensor histidine kinase [Streptomyces sp. S.PNR 29]|uniref:sensor histidine kinase n=1 Tax=Streptomyces sp. S.PNR 29 TaxID=2973805 RepID=UPI0025B0C735|nr:sensor histidine kinase [Streptomyces sp. S.PNR 29]MDN0196719.1 sensor histidine kinase [Streptomyces sp. S.PNR 29]
MQGDSAGITAHDPPGRWGQGDAAAIRPTSLPRRSVGTLLGCVTALLDSLYFLVVGTALGPFLLWPLTRTSALGILMTGARRLTALERLRRAVFFGDRFPEHYTASEQKILRYLAVRSYTGLLCGVVLGLLGFGIVLAGLLVRGMAQGTLRWDELLTQVLLGGVLLFLDVQGLHSLTTLDRHIARECFGPSERELLQRRIHELATSRAAIVRAVDTERRRIERDLHDGIQQRLVALGMLLGRARRGRHPERADALLRQAHQESQDILAELREVAWRIYPSALDSLGLEEALGGVSERCGILVRTEFDVDGPLPQPVQTAAYFVVSESVNNAAKHSRATAVSVRVALRGRVLSVQVRDNGEGGANPAGSGLSGLRSRVAALDGVLRVDSPEGGPTTITAELPCA